MNNNHFQLDMGFPSNRLPFEPNKDKQNEESYYFLLLSIYIYLKQNNNHTTAELFFKETNMDKIFAFPQYLEEPKTEAERMRANFINYFYYNTFYQTGEAVDFLADNWNQFWDIFVDKIKQSNQTYSSIDQYLLNHSIQCTCNFFLNF